MRAPRILVVNPNRSEPMTAAIGRVARGAVPGADVRAVRVPYGPAAVETEVDAALAAVAVLECVWEHRRAADAFVIACFDDPGLPAARELVDAPVVGIAESAALAALRSGGDVGALVVREDVAHRVARTLAGYGLLDVPAESLDGDVASLADGAEQTAHRFELAARRLAARGRRTAVLACAGFGQYAERIAAAADVTVVDGVLEGVRRAARLSGGRATAGPIPPTSFSGARPATPAWVKGTAA